MRRSPSKNAARDNLVDGGGRGEIRLAINEPPEDVVTLPKQFSCPCELSRKPCDEVVDWGWTNGPIGVPPSRLFAELGSFHESRLR